MEIRKRSNSAGNENVNDDDIKFHLSQLEQRALKRNRVVSIPIIQMVSKLLGNKWKALMQFQFHDAVDIDDVLHAIKNYDSQCSLAEEGFLALQMWKQKCGSKATEGALLRALLKQDLTDIAEKALLELEKDNFRNATVQENKLDELQEELVSRGKILLLDSSNSDDGIRSLYAKTRSALKHSKVKDKVLFGALSESEVGRCSAVVVVQDPIPKTVLDLVDRDQLAVVKIKLSHEIEKDNIPILNFEQTTTENKIREQLLRTLHFLTTPSTCVSTGNTKVQDQPNYVFQVNFNNLPAQRLWQKVLLQNSSLSYPFFVIQLCLCFSVLNEKGGFLVKMIAVLALHIVIRIISPFLCQWKIALLLGKQQHSEHWRTTFTCSTSSALIFYLRDKVYLNDDAMQQQHISPSNVVRKTTNLLNSILSSLMITGVCQGISAAAFLAASGVINHSAFLYNALDFAGLLCSFLLWHFMLAFYMLGLRVIAYYHDLKEYAGKFEMSNIDSYYKEWKTVFQDLPIITSLLAILLGLGYFNEVKTNIQVNEPGYAICILAFIFSQVFGVCPYTQFSTFQRSFSFVVTVVLCTLQYPSFQLYVPSLLLHVAFIQAFQLFSLKITSRIRRKGIIRAFVSYDRKKSLIEFLFFVVLLIVWYEVTAQHVPSIK